jgi:hypothetical protein
VAIAILMAVSLRVLFCVPLMEQLNLEMFSTRPLADSPGH